MKANVLAKNRTPLLAFIRSFPDNFKVQDNGGGILEVELLSVDVSDESVIPQVVQECFRRPEGKGKVGDKNSGVFGKGKDAVGGCGMSGSHPPVWFQDMFREMATQGCAPVGAKGKSKGKGSA